MCSVLSDLLRVFEPVAKNIMECYISKFSINTTNINFLPSSHRYSHARPKIGQPRTARGLIVLSEPNTVIC